MGLLPITAFRQPSQQLLTQVRFQVQKSFLIASNEFIVVTHLSNQNYEYCFRRESGYCYICYSRSYGISNGNGATGDQHSFGLSIATVAIADETAQTGTDCATDHILVTLYITLVFFGK